MSKFLTFLFLLAAFPLMGQVSPPPEILKAEIQELKTVVVTLRKENRLLENRNQQLMTDVLNLGNEIRSLRAQLEKIAPPPTEPEEALPPDAQAITPKTTPHRILYVNPNWHYLIVDCGSKSGVENGESGSVMRDGDIIATVKVTDTKPNQCVVELDLSSLSDRGVYPRSEDRVRFP